MMAPCTEYAIEKVDRLTAESFFPLWRETVMNTSRPSHKWPRSGPGDLRHKLLCVMGYPPGLTYLENMLVPKAAHFSVPRNLPRVAQAHVAAATPRQKHV